MALLAQLRPALSIALVSIFLSACQTLGPADLPESKAVPDLSAIASQAISEDMTAQLVDVLPPSAGPMRLKRDESSFGEALETSLARAGYSIEPGDAKAGTGFQPGLAYVVEEFEGNVLVRLATQTVDLARVYSQTAAGAEPVSPLSIKQRG